MSDSLKQVIDAFTLKAQADAAVSAVEPILDAALSPGHRVPITGTPFEVEKTADGKLRVHKINAPPTLEDLIK